MKRLLKLALLLGLAALGSTLLFIGCNGSSENEPEITVESIVASLQPINELTTLRVSVAGVVRASQDGHFWQGTNRLVLVARGNALYAIDMSQVAIDVSNDLVVLHLPPPRVTDAWIDVDESCIWDRRQGFLRSNDTQHLEEVAWHEAKQVIHEGSEREDYELAARRSAEQLISRILDPLIHPRKVQIEWHEEDQSSVPVSA